MSFRSVIFIAAASTALVIAGSAAAADKTSADVEHCARPIGTVAIEDAQRDWWSPLGLSNPEALIKLLAGRSNCLSVVARGQALAMRNQERAMADNGELQRGSNMGRGQVKAADYIIIPDIVDSNSNSGGGGLAGAALSGFGHHLGGFGGVLGGISIKSSSAHTLITLVNARTTEQEYVAEGLSKKNDIGLGGGGFGSWGGVVGGGYSNTSIGQVISVAYINAFNDLVHHMQQTAPGSAQAAAPIQAYRPKGGTALHQDSSNGSAVVEQVTSSDLLYPTGAQKGVWWEVDDENGNRGWVMSTQITAR